MKKTLIGLFLGVQAVLFCIILVWTYGSAQAPDVRYPGVLLCTFAAVLNALFKRNREAFFLMMAMLFTAAADFFLVHLDAHYALSIALFIVVQAFHFIRLRTVYRTHWKLSLGIRLLFMAAAVFVILAVLKIREPEVPLAVCYIFNLAANAFESAFAARKTKRFWLLFIGLLLFIGCDVSVGMNGMPEAFGLTQAAQRTASELIWIFYLPSQVLIVLSGLI